LFRNLGELFLAKINTQLGGRMMKLHTIFEYLLATTLILSSVDAFAYGDDKEKEICRHPKVQELTLSEYKPPENKEVAAESEFSFIVSGWADTKKIKIDGKGVSVPFTVENRDTFHKVKAKLPPDFNGKFVRLNARIPAVLGCYTTIGWLIKVADKAGAAQPATATTTQNAAPDAKPVPSGEATAPATPAPDDKAVVAP
jgi:hypothetical protein